MDAKEKLLKWCDENFNYDTQEWNLNNIPDEILDCVLDYMKAGYPKYEQEWADDFVADFICEIAYSKIWKIAKLWLKELFEDETKHLFD